MKALDLVVDTELEIHLYPVPERVAPLAAHVPQGRGLFLIDIENLMEGGPLAGSAAFATAVAGLDRAAPRREVDHAIVGVNPALFIDVYRAFPGSKVVARAGPDGADNAILDAVGDPEGVAHLYHRVVIASGDGVFADLATSFRDMGLRVELVARGGSISRNLRNAVHGVRLLGRPTSTTEELLWTS